MKSKKIIISIVIATFNSEKTLPLVLRALEKQTFPKENFEVLLVDGGSVDGTTAIAKQFACTIIPNPHTEPVHAKLLGYQHARGKYVIYLDHDEVLENKNSLKKKYAICNEHQDVHAVIGTGYKSPKGYSFINDYINEFGDPFSFFIYRLSKDARFFIPTIRKRYPILEETSDHLIVNFDNPQSAPIIELCAAGSMIDKEYMVKHFPQTLTELLLIPHFFYILITREPHIAISKMDILVHYSSESLSGYSKKIKWRIKNNVYHLDKLGKAGYSGRVAFEGKISQFKKYLFIPYGLTLLFPAIDATHLSITRRNMRYVMHILFCFYTACAIVIYTFLKLFGYRPKLKNYDESVIVT